MTIIRNGHPKGWGRILELLNNKDRFGLGYNSQNLKKPTPIAEKGKVLPLSEYFPSVWHLVDDHICASEEDVEEEGGLVFKKTEGRGATKWTVLEVPEVTMIKN